MITKPHPCLVLTPSLPRGGLAPQAHCSIADCWMGFYRLKSVFPLSEGDCRFGDLSVVTAVPSWGPHGPLVEFSWTVLTNSVFTATRVWSLLLNMNSLINLCACLIPLRPGCSLNLELTIYFLGWGPRHGDLLSPTQGQDYRCRAMPPALSTGAGVPKPSINPLTPPPPQCFYLSGLETQPQIPSLLTLLTKC